MNTKFLVIVIATFVLFSAGGLLLLFPNINQKSKDTIPADYTRYLRTEDITRDDEPYEPKAVEGWITFSFKDFKVIASIPETYTVDSVGEFSAIMGPKNQVYSVGPTRFAYISIVPNTYLEEGLPEGTEILGYIPSMHQSLLSMEIEEEKAIGDNPDQAEWYTYKRIVNLTNGRESAKVFINSKPWEFPAGTVEYKYIFERENETIIFGGFIDPNAQNNETLNFSILNQMFNRLEFR